MARLWRCTGLSLTGPLALPCSRQAPSTEPCASSSSHSKSFDQLKCGPYLGSGDTADSVSVTSAGSSSSDVEEINISFIPESPDGQEKKVQDSGSLGPASAQGGRRQVRPIYKAGLGARQGGWGNLERLASLLGDACDEAPRRGGAYGSWVEPS